MADPESVARGKSSQAILIVGTGGHGAVVADAAQILAKGIDGEVKRAGEVYLDGKKYGKWPLGHDQLPKSGYWTDTRGKPLQRRRY